jgi:hypothetical protein
LCTGDPAGDSHAVGERVLLQKQLYVAAHLSVSRKNEIELLSLCRHESCGLDQQQLSLLFA